MTDANLYTRQPQQLVIYSTAWCPDCRRARFFVLRNHIPFIEVDVDTDPAAEAFVRNLNNGNRSVPTLVFPDGSLHVEPSNDQLVTRFSNS